MYEILTFFFNSFDGIKKLGIITSNMYEVLMDFLKISFVTCIFLLHVYVLTACTLHIALLYFPSIQKWIIQTAFFAAHAGMHHMQFNCTEYTGN